MTQVRVLTGSLEHSPCVLDVRDLPTLPILPSGLSYPASIRKQSNIAAKEEAIIQEV